MRTLLIISSILAVATDALPADVAQFRGIGARGVAEEKNLPVQWSEKEGVRWKMSLPGRGLSNPVVADGRVYVTACSGFEQKRLHVLCFDVKDGKKLWERQFWATGNTFCHPKTDMAAPSPVADGKHVYALFATGDLACLDKDGNLEWYRSLVGDYPTVGNNLGLAASPTLWKDRLIVCMENVGESFAAGIDVATGENRWRVDRPRGLNWASPIVFENQGRAEVVFQTGGDLAAHDSATGKRLWTASGSFGTMPSPTFGDGMIFAPGGKLTALRPGSGADKPQTLWQNNKLGTGYCSPVYYRGFVYTLSNKGVINCAEPGTGKILWSERADGNYAGTPLAADGKIYVASEDGVTTVLQAGAEAKILAANSLPESFVACPVASHGALFLRSDKSLYCIGK